MKTSKRKMAEAFAALAVAVAAVPAKAHRIGDFLPGGRPLSDRDPLARVRLCENDLDSIWPTAIDFARYEDVTGAARAYVENWGRTPDPEGFVRDHEDEAVNLMTELYGLKARFDFIPRPADDGLAGGLEDLMLRLESIHFFLGFVAPVEELRTLEENIRTRLGDDLIDRARLDEIRAAMEVLTQQALLKSMRDDDGYEVPDEVYELWRAVFAAVVKGGD